MKRHQTPAGRNPKEPDVLAAAAQWHNRLDEENIPQARAEFDSWLMADPRHRSAFHAIERMWSKMAESRVDPRILSLRREALDATKHSRLLRLAAAAAVVVAIVGATMVAAPRLLALRSIGTAVTAALHTEGGAFRTAVGERSSVTLADGSTVVLNTNSRIDVSFTPAQRRVRLLRGQAWFQVTKNPARPFVVEAGDQRISALGTAFDVRLATQHDSVQVTLVEGRVSVEAIQPLLVGLIRPRPLAVQLSPGESLTTSDSAPASKRKSDVLGVANWRLGRIVFDDDTLASAIEEVNRYSTTQIVLADTALAALRVSGVFKAGHIQSFIETVTGQFPIQVTEQTGEHIVLAAKRPPKILKS